MAAPWSTPVGCRSGHEGPLRVDLSRLIVVRRPAGIGAELPISLCLAGGSSCPFAVIDRRHPERLKRWNADHPLLRVR